MLTVCTNTLCYLTPSKPAQMTAHQRHQKLCVPKRAETIRDATTQRISFIVIICLMSYTGTAISTTLFLGRGLRGKSDLKKRRALSFTNVEVCCFLYVCVLLFCFSFWFMFLDIPLMIPILSFWFLLNNHTANHETIPYLIPYTRHRKRIKINSKIINEI